MKKVIYVFIISFFAIKAQAQLAGTKWKATLQLDQPLDVMFNFSADTLSVTNAADNSDLETLKYFLKDTVLTLQKLYGQSGCDTTSKGAYAYKISGNEMLLKLISDDCLDRSNAIKDIKLNKQE